MKNLVELAEGLPVGTNLALLQFLWMLVSGALLPPRGAIFPVLKAIGLRYQSTRRAWAAFQGGVWQRAFLLGVWREQIEGMPGWRVDRHEDYRAIPVDVTAFWRPKLANCPSQHYHPGANRALLEFAEGEALRRGYHSIYLYTNVKMTANQVLYPKIGYVAYERKFDQGYDRIFYRKKLG